MNTNLTLKSVTCVVSLGTICVYHSRAKVSRAQLVKQTLPKYNFHAYNTEYLTFHCSIPPKPKVYFLHPGLLLFQTKGNKKIKNSAKLTSERAELNLQAEFISLLSECTSCILYFMYVKTRNGTLYIKTGKYIINVINVEFSYLLAKKSGLSTSNCTSYFKIMRQT